MGLVTGSFQLGVKHSTPLDQGCQTHLRLRPEQTKCYSERGGRTNKKTLDMIEDVFSVH